jgi:hypothetical protein
MGKGRLPSRRARNFVGCALAIGIMATSVDASASPSRPRSGSSARAQPKAAVLGRARVARPAMTPVTNFTGFSFDACNAPSISTMRAWRSSPYKAANIYIGGVNRACSNTRLNAYWVRSVRAQGWRLIPTFVGLQAPDNVCGCAPMSSDPSEATRQGIDAARGAAIFAWSLKLPAGSPIYYDMEGYPLTSSNIRAVMAYLQAWTVTLHQIGFHSGVYSSNGGIYQLVRRRGTGYVEPDELWYAYWNGVPNLFDPLIPNAWFVGRRLHQYSGNLTASYGGVTMNIDADYGSSAVVP